MAARPKKTKPKDTKRAPKKSPPARSKRKAAAPPKSAKATGAKKARPAKRAPKGASAPAPKKRAKTAAPKNTKAASTKSPARKIPPPTPSERALAAVGALPRERPLNEKEAAAMAKVSEIARKAVGSERTPAAVIGKIAAFVDDVRSGRREAPKSQDLKLGLGVLWGEQVRALEGWSWVHLTYPDGFASYALVPADRAFACFPLNRLPDAMRGGGTNTSARVFDSIREGALPTRKAQAYLVIG